MQQFGSLRCCSAPSSGTGPGKPAEPPTLLGSPNHHVQCKQVNPDEVLPAGDSAVQLSNCHDASGKGEKPPVKTSSFVRRTSVLPAVSRTGTDTMVGNFTLDDLQLRNTQGTCEESLFEADGFAPDMCFMRANTIRFFTSQICLRSVALLVFVWTTFVMSFGMPEVYDVRSDGHWALIDVIFDTVYFAGTFMRLRTSVIDPVVGIEYLGSSQILNQTLSAPTFWLDVTSFISLLSFAPVLTGLRAFRLLRSWRLLLGSEQKDVGEGRSAPGGDIGRLIELILVVFVLGHLFACVWFSVMFAVDGQEVYELMGDGASTNDKFLYLLALRDGMLILTESPNQATASRNDPAIAAMVLVLRPAGAIIMAWIFAQLVVTLQRMTILPSRQSKHMSLINAAMRSLGLPVSIRMRIMRYHCYLAVHHNQSAYSALFSGLSVNLSIELKLYLFRKLISDAPFFKDLTPTALHNLVQGFDEAVYSPGDIIIRKGDSGSDMFFIVKGTIEVLAERNRLLAVRRPGDYFGEVALVLRSMRRTACVRAKTYCILARFDKEKFHLALRGNPDQRKMMIDRIRSFHNVKIEDTDPACYQNDVSGSISPCSIVHE